MRAEISLTVTPSDRRQLKALVRDHNAPQKHVLRAEIVLLTAEGVARMRIMRRTDKSKTCVAGRTPIGVPGATAIAATITDAKVAPQPGH